MSNGLTTVRENLLRQSAYVDQALALVVPASKRGKKQPTRERRAYGGRFASPVRSPYCRPDCQCERILARRRAMDWLCNWQTRDSVTSRTAAISLRFMSCS